MCVKVSLGDWNDRQKLFFPSLSSFILFKVLGVSSVLWYSWTPNSWREQEDLSVSVPPLTVDQIFATVCCAVFYLDMGVSI